MFVAIGQYMWDWLQIQSVDILIDDWLKYQCLAQQMILDMINLSLVHWERTHRTQQTSVTIILMTFTCTCAHDDHVWGKEMKQTEAFSCSTWSVIAQASCSHVWTGAVWLYRGKVIVTSLSSKCFISEEKTFKDLHVGRLHSIHEMIVFTASSVRVYEMLNTLCVGYLFLCCLCVASRETYWSSSHSRR